MKTPQDWAKLAEDRMYCRQLGIAWDNTWRPIEWNDAVRLYNSACAGLPYQGPERQFLIETIMEAKA